MSNAGKMNVNKTVVLELNYQCNLHCIHCYIKRLVFLHKEKMKTIEEFDTS